MRFWIGKLLLFTGACLLVLELLFRFVFPACELPASVQIPGGFLVSDADYQQSGYFSLGRVPTEGYHWSINNHGWNSTIDYLPREERVRPLIALIGDSSVEGHWCNVEEHVDSWLHLLLEESFDVYAFGRGGMPLIQMVLLAELVDSLYRPDLFVFLMGHEVVHGSLVPDAAIEYHYLAPDSASGSFLIMEPSRRVPSTFSRTAMQSALVRYVRIHLMLEFFPLMEVRQLPINRNAALTQGDVRELLPSAAGFMLERMSQTLGDRHLLIVTDDWMDRNILYGNDEIAPSVINLIQEDMRVLSEVSGEFPNIGYLGTEEAFHQARDSTGNSFDAADGRHLNGYGNYVTAAAIHRQLTASGIISDILSAWENGEPLRGAGQDDRFEGPDRP